MNISLLPCLVAALIITLSVAYADEPNHAAAEKAMRDAQQTHNAYVIDAVRQQLLRDHPEFSTWLTSQDAMHIPAGKVDALDLPVTDPKASLAPSPVGVHYKGEIQAGLEADTGNTRGSSVNGNGNVTRDSEDWRFLTQASAQIDKSRGITTKETYRFLEQANYKLHPDERIMTTFFWTSDRFTGFRERYEEVSGLSNDWKLTDHLKLTTEIAAGAQQIELVDHTSSSEPILWTRAFIEWPFAEQWTLTEDLRNSYGQHYTFFSSNAALTTQLYQNWKLRLSEEDNYVTNPPLNREGFDTTSLVSLVYEFK